LKSSRDSGFNKSIFMEVSLAQFIKEKRKLMGLTQQELSIQSGLGLRFVREAETGKATLRMDKVNLLLAFWGYELGPVPIKDSL
jgi:y4mF family transcriptional regulator